MAETTQTYGYETLAEALLTLLADGEAHPIATTIEHLADNMQLNDTDRHTMLEAGIPRFNYAVYRLHRFLTRIDFIHKVRPGVYRMSLAGQAFVERSPQLNLDLLQQFHRNSVAGEATISTAPSLRQTLQTQLRDIAPDAFQRLVLALLKSMNYQGSFEGSIENPEAEDFALQGVIREDRLGLKDTIYVEAERAASGTAISAAAMEGFIIQMQQQDAPKGIFITTAGFESAARHQAETAASQIALLDGEFLVQLLIEYRVGIIEVQQITQVIDPAYF